MVRGSYRGWLPADPRVIPSLYNRAKIPHPPPHWLPVGTDIITPGSRWIIQLTPTLLVNPHLSTSATRYQRPMRFHIIVRLTSVRMTSLAPPALYANREPVDLSPSAYSGLLQSPYYNAALEPFNELCRGRN